MALTDPAIYLPFAAALTALSGGLTWLMLRAGILDTPNQRSSHRRPVPRGGGVGIVVACLVAILAFLAWGDGGVATRPQLVVLAAASLGVAAVGLLDDLGVVTSFKLKLLAQLLAALLLVGAGAAFGPVPLPGRAPVSLGAWHDLLTVVWVIGMTNAFNFMDGLDGLAAGTAVVAAVFFGIFALGGGAPFAVVASLAILAAALGFLVFNAPPAKIFMGDVGSQFLGFMFAAVAVLAAQGAVPAVSPLVMPLLFFHFIFDTAFTFARRLLAGHRVTEGHREHLYQLLNRLGVPHLGVSLFHMAVTGAQGAGAYWLIALPGEKQWQAFLPFLLFQVVYGAAVWHLARRRGLLAV